jgi:hypothetical protein
MAGEGANRQAKAVDAEAARNQRHFFSLNPFLLHFLQKIAWQAVQARIGTQFAAAAAAGGYVWLPLLCSPPGSAPGDQSYCDCGARPSRRRRGSTAADRTRVWGLHWHANPAAAAAAAAEVSEAEQSQSRRHQHHQREEGGATSWD